MNSIAKSLAVLACFGAAALVASAQPALKIATVDIATLYDTHYKTEAQVESLRQYEQRAQIDLEELNAEGNELVEQYKEMVEQSRNPALTAQARQNAECNAAQKLEEIEHKRGEIEDFQMRAQRYLQERVQTHRDLLIEEITMVVVDLAKAKGATLVVDTSGQTMIGISSVVYADPAYDITEEASARLNQDRPGAAAAPAPAPATAPAAAAAPAAPAPATRAPARR